MPRSLGWVWACALTLILTACGGAPTTVETPPPPPTCTDHAANNYGGPLPCTYPDPMPTASLDLSTYLVTVPASVVAMPGCKNSVSATHSWNNSTATSGAETTAINTAGSIPFRLVCRNARGDSAVATRLLTATKPTLAGNVCTYNSGVGHIGEVRFYVVGSAGTDSTQVVSTNQDGSCGSWKVDVSSYNDFCVHLESSDPGGVIRPWERTVCQSEQGNAFNYVRDPGHPQVVNGWYDGMIVSFSLENDAYNRYDPSDAQSSPLLRSLDSANACYGYSLATYPKEARPVLLAIDRVHSLMLPFADSDSVSMWKAANLRQSEIGMSLWRPGNYAEASFTPGIGLGTWKGVLVRTAPNAASGLAATNGDPRNLVYSLVTIDLSSVGDSIAFTHELMHGDDLWHKLGTLMAPGINRNDPGEQRLGPTLVAIFQMLYSNTDLARQTGYRSGIPGEHQAEKRLLGHTVDAVCSSQQ